MIKVDTSNWEKEVIKLTAETEVARDLLVTALVKAGYKTWRETDQVGSESFEYICFERLIGTK